MLIWSLRIFVCISGDLKKHFPAPPPPPPPPPGLGLSKERLHVPSKQINKMTYSEFRQELNTRLGRSIKKGRDYLAADSEFYKSGELEAFSKKARSLPASLNSSPQSSPHASPQSSPKTVHRKISMDSAPVIWQAASEGAVEYALIASHAGGNDLNGIDSKDLQGTSADPPKRTWFGLSGWGARTGQQSDVTGLAGRLNEELKTMNKPFVDHKHTRGYQQGGRKEGDGPCILKGKDLNILAPTGL